MHHFEKNGIIFCCLRFATASAAAKSHPTGEKKNKR
jgi:hypothetical protein